MAGAVAGATGVISRAGSPASACGGTGGAWSGLCLTAEAYCLLGPGWPHTLPESGASACKQPLQEGQLAVEINSLDPADEQAIAQVARIVVDAFRGHTPTWPDLASAEAEVRKSFAEERISRVAREGGVVLGWIGGIRTYHGHAWELHPLVVDPARHREGVGRALVADLERLVAERGATTLYLGTDDEDGRTSLGGIDLYPDPLAYLAGITNPGHHPYGFYLACGFSLVGVIPDANGPGRPDILMAKRVGPARDHGVSHG